MRAERDWARDTLGGLLPLAASLGPALLLFLLVLSPVLGWTLRAGVVALCVLAVARPDAALLITAAFLGFGSILANLARVPALRVTEVLVLVTLFGCFGRAIVAAPLRRAIAREISGPIVAFAVAAIMSTLVWQRVYQFQQGDWPAYAAQVTEFLTKSYFVRPGNFWFAVSAAVMLEGLALSIVVAALCRVDGTLFERALRMLSVGGAGLAVMSAVRLAEIHLRSPAAIAAMRATSAGLRISPQISDSIAAGSYFAVCWIASLGLAVAAAGRMRILWLAAGAPLIVALYLTGSRSVILAALAGLVLLSVALTFRSRGIPARSVVAFAVVAVVAMIVSYPWFIGRDVAGTKAAKSMTIRGELFEAGLGVIGTRPLFGVGIDRFYLVAGAHASPELNAMWRGRKNPHNDFLRIGAELGLVGLGLFIWILADAARRTWRGIAQTADPRLAAIACGVVAFLVTSLVGNPLMLREVSYAFWIALGLAVGGGAARPVQSAPPQEVQSAGGIRRWQPWVTATICLALVVSVPYRARQEIADLDITRVTYGLFDWSKDANGMRYRWSGPTATLFVDGRVRQVNIPLQGTLPSGLPQQVDIRFDGKLANRVQVSAEWQRIRLDLPRGRPGAPRRIDLTVTPTWTPGTDTPGPDDERERGVKVGEISTLTPPM